ncbi:MAG: hypothetical protein JSW54_10160 [Fidelibacterota bacterium]|nr:MAG: hypothetical protein JSW54_10160 [Candidatus Neomarinimicrobiota bacterium]
MKITPFYVVLLGTLLAGFSALGNDNPGSGSTAALTPVTHTLRLEEEKVWVKVYQRPGMNLNFVSLHDNENTSAEAAKAYIRAHGGRLVELVHGRGRTVVIRRNGVLHHFDPNRMFTTEGLRHSLKYFHNLSEENLGLASRFASQVGDIIGLEAGKSIISVHNNTPGKLTIHDFKPGEWYGEDTRDVFINPAEDPDDFFFTNSPALFRALKSLRYNAALMIQNPPDRGSLGNLVDNLGGLYVLVEAEHGHLTRQIAMLEDLGRLLGGDSFPTQ